MRSDTIGGTFFANSGPWYEPTDHVRGPWSADACHAGPPTATIARELERLLPDRQLSRLTVELGRPVPMAGFGIESEVVHQGRTVSTTRAHLVDTDGRVCVRATALHLLPQGPFDVLVGEAPPHPAGSLAESQPGPFAISEALHDKPCILDGAMEARYPPGQSGAVGPTTAWLRTIDLVPGEVPSPFQRICTLADCGNALSRHAEPWEVTFLNADLTVSIHRPPEGEWLGSQVSAAWQPNGIGIADGLLFDQLGVVGRALQTLVLRPVT